MCYIMSSISYVHLSTLQMFINTNIFIKLPKAMVITYFNIIQLLIEKKLLKNLTI